MAKVSIIIPTYNVEEYLEECLESVVRQTLSDIEIVCVNDGSTDSSLEILKRYAERDERIIIVDQPNGGYGKAMNAGMDRATGEYIGIVEPDDYVGLEMYEDLYKVAKENDLDFVKSDFYRFVTSDNGDVNFKYFALSKDPDDYNKVFNPSETPYAMNYVVNTWCGIYRKSFLDEFGIRHNETPGASFQDNGFFFQTFAFGRRAMIIDKAYYRNRRDNPNSSVKDPGKVYAANIEYDYIRDIIMEHPDTWNRFKYMYWKKRFTNTIMTLNRIAPEYKKEYCRNASREFNAAKNDGLVRRKDYEDFQWERMQMILKDPDSFAIMKMGEESGGKSSKNKSSASSAEIDKLRRDSRRLNDILNSNSYKLGFTLTAVPRYMKETVKKVLRNRR
ncbi:MAG: glycosyltransferase [Blautia sp.]|nr:glycosyltransferase [Blautia sp.]